MFITAALKKSGGDCTASLTRQDRHEWPKTVPLETVETKRMLPEYLCDVTGYSNQCGIKTSQSDGLRCWILQGKQHVLAYGAYMKYTVLRTVNSI